MIFIITKKKRILFILLCVFITGMLMKQAYELNNSIVSTSSQAKAYVAIVIDDFGYNGAGTDEMLALDIPFTAAVMPFLEASSIDADKAHNANKDVIIHMSMDSYTGKKAWLGPRTITTELSDEAVVQMFDEALEELKWAVGMNNHMGSKITEDNRIMKDILNIVSQKDLVFVDSMTTSNSVSGKIAQEIGATVFQRDVFLDSTQDQSKIEKNLLELGEKALKKGYAVGIGHVGPEGGKVTAAAIKKIAPELQKKGIEFVKISQLKEIKQNIN